eukprot:5665499-Amphidinium_carterae.1
MLPSHEFSRIGLAKDIATVQLEHSGCCSWMDRKLLEQAGSGSESGIKVGGKRTSLCVARST